MAITLPCLTTPHHTITIIITITITITITTIQSFVLEKKSNTTKPQSIYDRPSSPSPIHNSNNNSSNSGTSLRYRAGYVMGMCGHDKAGERRGREKKERRRNQLLEEKKRNKFRFLMLHKSISVKRINIIISSIRLTASSSSSSSSSPPQNQEEAKEKSQERIYIYKRD